MNTETGFDLGWAAFIIVLVMLAVPLLVIIASALNTYLNNRNLHQERLALIQRGESLETIQHMYESAAQQPFNPWRDKLASLNFAVAMLGAGSAFVVVGLYIAPKMLPQSSWGPILVIAGTVCLATSVFSAAGTLWLRREGGPWRASEQPQLPSRSAPAPGRSLDRLEGP